MVKLEPIDIIRAIIDPESVREGTPAYDVEKEFQLEVAKNAGVLLARYKQANPKKHWSEEEETNALIGMCGQAAFQKLLEYLKVSYDMDDPTATYRKPYDFKLAIGTIEVKTYHYYCRKALIKEGEWKGNDYLIVWRFTDKPALRINFEGWLTKKEVEGYSVTPKGKSKYTPKASARIIELEDLHHPERFTRMLLT